MKAVFLTGQAPKLEKQPRGRDEVLEVSRKVLPSVWETAWVDCLVQACVATPWIIVSAVGKLLFHSHV